MEKAKIVAVYNYGKVHRYVIEKQKDIHGILCNMFGKMGFDEDQAEEADMIFDNVECDYIYIGESKDFEAQLFVTKNKINLILKTEKTQEEIAKVLKNYLVFPQ